MTTRRARSGVALEDQAQPGEREEIVHLLDGLAVGHDPLSEAALFHEAECQRLLKAAEVVLPAYDQVLKCSHIFNLLDARGAISVTERVGVIARVRKLALGVAQAWMKHVAQAQACEEVA